jgi:Tol biopolymer transport system component
MVTEGVSASYVLTFDRITQDWTQFYYAPHFSFPTWSPDGQWLVGILGPNAHTLANPLLLVSADGREWQEIMNDHPGYKYTLGWLDNDHILIQNELDSEKSEEDGSRYDEIQVYNLQTREVTVITGIQRDANIFTLTTPDLSPDRSQLAYTMINKLEGTSEITVIQLEQGTQSSFTFDSGIVSWSTNGEWLTVQAIHENHCDIHLVRPDGTGAYKIFSGDQNGACNLVWSPDSKFILVPALAQNPTIPRLYVITVATSETRLVELPDVGVAFEWPVASWVP